MERHPTCSKIKRAIWTDEIRAFVRVHYRGISSQQLTDLVNEQFDAHFTKEQIRAFKKNHKLASGYDCRIKSGHVPFCKGKKQIDFMSPEAIERSKTTRFQSGHKPHNYMPVGSEVIKGDGYWWRKIAEPNKWRQVHRIVWEETHGKPIPADHVVIFLDMDRDNLSPGNLRLISRREHRTLNQQGLRTHDKELTEIGITVARLHERIYDKTTREKENGNKEHIDGFE